jgi:hypothetical protein
VQSTSERARGDAVQFDRCGCRGIARPSALRRIRDARCAAPARCPSVATTDFRSARFPGTR